MFSAKKRLLHRLLESYERSANYGQDGPWRRAVIVNLDERAFPEEWRPESGEQRQALLDAARELQRAGAVELRFHRGLRDGVPNQVRVTGSTIQRALQLAKEHGFNPADQLLSEVAAHAQSLVSPLTPAWMASYLESVAQDLRTGRTKSMGVSLARLKAHTRRYLDALTAAAHISQGNGGMVRVVSERIFGGTAGSVAPSKRLRMIASEVAAILVRADAEWAIRPSRPRDVFAYYGVRSKPTFLMCAGDIEFTAPFGPRALRDDSPYAIIAESLVDALASSIAMADGVTVTLIENETPFILYVAAAGGPSGLGARRELAVYTAGFATPLLLRFLRQAAAGPMVTFQHWGDADPGGLQIWWSIRRTIGREVSLFRMSPEWYEAAASEAGASLTPSQRRGLSRLQTKLQSETGQDVQQALVLMEAVLRVGLWVEQERHEA